MIELVKKKNWNIAHIFAVEKWGAGTAIVLGRLMNAEEHYGDEFFIPMPQIAKDTGLSESTVQRSIEKLSKDGVITTIARGIPRKNYYKFTNKIVEYINHKQ